MLKLANNCWVYSHQPCRACPLHRSWRVNVGRMASHQIISKIVLYRNSSFIIKYKQYLF